jgi:subtilisin family serine protease
MDRKLAAAPAALGAEEHIATSGPPRTPAPRYAPDRVIVEWRSGVAGAERAAGRAAANTSAIRGLGSTRFQLVHVGAGQTVDGAIRALRRNPDVRVAQRDGYDAPNAVPNDPLFGQLWGLRNAGLGIDGFPGAVAGDDIHAVAAWDRTVGTPSTVVADIDTGYRFDHPDLADVAWTNPSPTFGDVHGADFVGADADSPTTDGDPTDDQPTGGHGVHTAGTIGAQGDNGVGISGVAQKVRIMPLRVCSFSAFANGVACPTSSIVAAMNYAGAHGARVANLSLGGTASQTAERDAMAMNPQTLFVISAGNDTEDNDAAPHFPCNYNPATSGMPGAIDNVICVAATDQADHLASFSDWGATTVDVGAPGTEILSTFPVRKFIDESFEVNDFASKWSATGANGGFARSNESPLTSFGVTDSPGTAPAANTTRASTSTAVTMAPGFTSCELDQTRTVSLGGGTYSYTVLLDGSPVAGASPSSSGKFFLTLGTALASGGSVQVRFQYTAGGSPTSANGVWLDDIELTCFEPVGSSTGYEFLQGTSMAAPHVTGAAALLFSLKPAATVSDVKQALLSTVTPDPALSGLTTTGGRVDVAAALDPLVPPQPPAPPTTTPPATTPPVTTAPTATPTTPRKCVVPRLKGKTLSKAKSALKHAHCALGKVKKPKKPKGTLVVKSSSPPAGRSLKSGSKVNVTLVRKRKH